MRRVIKELFSHSELTKENISKELELLDISNFHRIRNNEVSIYDNFYVWLFQLFKFLHATKKLDIVSNSLIQLLKA